MNIRFLLAYNLPANIKGYSRVDLEGNYCIYINECLSDKAKLRTVAHEVRHISCGDFYSDKSVAEKEWNMSVTNERKNR